MTFRDKRRRCLESSKTVVKRLLKRLGCGFLIPPQHQPLPRIPGMLLPSNAAPISSRRIQILSSSTSSPAEPPAQRTSSDGVVQQPTEPQPVSERGSESDRSHGLQLAPYMLPSGQLAWALPKSASSLSTQQQYAPSAVEHSQEDSQEDLPKETTPRGKRKVSFGTVNFEPQRNKVPGIAGKSPLQSNLKVKSQWATPSPEATIVTISTPTSDKKLGVLRGPISVAYSHSLRESSKGIGVQQTHTSAGYLNITSSAKLANELDEDIAKLQTPTIGKVAAKVEAQIGLGTSSTGNLSWSGLLGADAEGALGAGCLRDGAGGAGGDDLGTGCLGRVEAGGAGEDCGVRLFA
ncbi:hypothetical protein CYMTET_38890 [Cymbomonas tetramitiformis]|uniref:Uncharacterized protein n=1 Tax=Cymbomonas tetramitiformis TaxID=36881 RepID=A0AAE0CCV9_9CHLO|nr:hypothetical protein CYMTET_38890 [Cymbomonas tetramitiformis]